MTVRVWARTNYPSGWKKTNFRSLKKSSIKKFHWWKKLSALHQFWPHLIWTGPRRFFVPKLRGWKAIRHGRHSSLEANVHRQRRRNCVHEALWCYRGSGVLRGSIGIWPGIQGFQPFPSIFGRRTNIPELFRMEHRSVERLTGCWIGHMPILHPVSVQWQVVYFLGRLRFFL